MLRNNLMADVTHELRTPLTVAIVKTIVEAHGGRVEARSAGKGRGSTYAVMMPMELPA